MPDLAPQIASSALHMSSYSMYKPAAAQPSCHETSLRCRSVYVFSTLCDAAQLRENYARSPVTMSAGSPELQTRVKRLAPCRLIGLVLRSPKVQ